MALGVDQMFAAVCTDLKIPWIAFIPCLNQGKVWPKESRDQYDYLLAKAAEVVHVSKREYFHGCMQDRNVAMRNWGLKDDRNLLLAVWDGSRGGTGNMVEACGAMEMRRFDPRKGEVDVPHT